MGFECVDSRGVKRTKRSVSITAAAISLAVAVAGCSVGSPFNRPETPKPAVWSQPATPGDLPTADWWRNFRAPVLDDLMTKALNSNFDLAAATARIREAEAQARIAGAAQYPAISAGASPTRLAESSTLKSATNYPTTLYTSTYTVDIAASYQVDFWGKTAAAIEAAKYSAEAARFDREVLILSTQSGLATAYFDMLGTNDRLIAAREGLKAAEEVLAAIKDRVALGTDTDVDEAQQESVVATQSARIPLLQQEIVTDLNAIAIFVGAPPESVKAEVGSLNAINIPTVGPGLPSDLLRRRPDVREAEANLAAANANITVARAAFFPSLSLTGLLGFESPQVNALLVPSSTLFSVAASLVQPIFQGGALEGQLDFTKARYVELVANYQKSAISAYSNVENALNAVRRTTDEEQAQNIAVQAAERAFRLAQEQMQGGVATITTVLNTQTTLFAAEDSYVQARLAHIEAIVSLFNALGGGWQGSA
jgi:NodT family efflux transporter outer membrane factor (OMF) lipoprotein